jgi:hypothetical protein
MHECPECGDHCWCERDKDECAHNCDWDEEEYFASIKSFDDFDEEC